jgi:hypothetical protein
MNGFTSFVFSFEKDDVYLIRPEVDNDEVFEADVPNRCPGNTYLYNLSLLFITMHEYFLRLHEHQLIISKNIKHIY